MTYILKNDKEADRLQRQSMSENYSIKKELSEFNLPENSKVLEIGCGAGTLIKYINSEYSVTSHACDLQDEHISFCKENLSSNITFFQHDILKSELPNKYDFIFMRYVAHHLGAETFTKSLDHIYNSLNPGGKFIIIDFDGLMENIGTLDNELNNYFEKINQNFTGDLKIGRKIPTILNEYGFNKIDYKIQTITFSGSERIIEREQWVERLGFAKDSFVKILGSELDYSNFLKLFLKEIDSPAVPFFTNKFIITGQKS